MKAMKSEGLYIPFVTVHGPFDHVITNSPKRVPNNFSFSKSTAPRLPSRHVEHHQTMTTAWLNGARDDNNTQPPH